MSNSTQNDWEKEVESLFYLIFNQDKFPSLRGTYDDYLKFKEDTIKIVKVSFGKLLADARREVIDRVESEGVVNRAWIKIDGNEFILVGKEFLATLREEEQK